MNKLKSVYIAHPLRGNIQGNIEKVTSICKSIIANGEVVPFSPIHAFGFMSVDGDQSQVMGYCLELLSKVDELWVFGDWSESEGCYTEVAFAFHNKIPIQFMDQRVKT